MKFKKSYLIIFVLILFLSFLYHGFAPNFNEPEVNNNTNFRCFLSADNSHLYEWYYIWSGDFIDGGTGVIVDSSNAIYVGGYTNSFGAGNHDLLLVKYDGNGVQQWNRTWGGGNLEVCWEMAVDSLDNIYLTGYTQSFSIGGWDVVLVKYNSDGVQQWNRTWGGSDYEEGLGITVDSLDNIYVGGYTNSFGIPNNMILLKYNSSGVLLWNNTWGGASAAEKCYDVVVDSMDNVYIGGYTYSFGAGASDMVIVKFNNAGVQQWNRTWGGSGLDYSRGMAVDSVDNIYIGGSTYSFGAGEDDVVLVKYNNIGIQQWNRTWGGGSYDTCEEMAVDSRDNVYLTGDTLSFGVGDRDILLIKYDSLGTQQWNRTWGGVELDRGNSVILDSLNNIYLGGYTNSFGAVSSDLLLLKYSKIPEIKIYSPRNNEFFSSIAPNFNISILEPNLDTTWYTLDNGEPIIFNETSGKINQTEWDLKEEDLISIKFYANNTLGKEGYSEVLVFKDTTKPEIFIYSPSQDEKFGNAAPDYLISIVEPNLASFWYTIDNGVTNYTITEISDKINQTAWDAAPYGSITIRFYAQDLAGNSDYSEVVVKKSKKKQEILGYQILLFVSMIGLITAISLKKKLN